VRRRGRGGSKGTHDPDVVDSSQNGRSQLRAERVPDPVFSLGPFVGLRSPQRNKQRSRASSNTAAKEGALCNA